ncbi:MAG: hypothetical protein ABI595_15975 [Actinomycetota bacterium]
MTYDDLPDKVRRDGGVSEVDMGTLRDMEGAGKLGKYVRANISAALGERRLGHFPEELPIYQHETVRVYERDSAVGRTVAAVLHPSAAGDKVLRALGDGDDDEHEVLEQIRKLVAV